MSGWRTPSWRTWSSVNPNTGTDSTKSSEDSWCVRPSSWLGPMRTCTRVRGRTSSSWTTSSFRLPLKSDRFCISILRYSILWSHKSQTDLDFVNTLKVATDSIKYNWAVKNCEKLELAPRYRFGSFWGPSNLTKPELLLFVLRFHLTYDVTILVRSSCKLLKVALESKLA